jgi:hypothetical protein
VHSPAVANAAKTAAIIDLRTLDSSALDVSPLRGPVAFRLSAPAVEALTQLLAIQLPRTVCEIQNCCNSKRNKIGRNPYDEGGLHRNVATAQFNPLAAVGGIRLI